MFLFLKVCWHLYFWNLGTLLIVCFNSFLCRMLLDLHAAQAGNEDVKALKQIAPKENIAEIHNFVRCRFSDMEVFSSAYHGIFIRLNWKAQLMKNHKTSVMCISKPRSFVYNVLVALTTPTQGVWEELLNYHPPPSNLNWTSMSKAKFIRRISSWLCK